MSRVPRLLPLVGVAIGGVLAIKALTEAPQLYLATRAWAEDVARPAGPPRPAIAPDASILSGGGASSAAKAPPPACAPTAAELAKEAGLSPAELQVLQSLGDRRGQLDQRESSLDTQVQLIAAAEAKLDARIQQMNGLKGDIQALLGQADQQAQAEADRLVHVYEDMPEKKAAAAMTVLDDSVRIPIAARMKERKLAAILAQMLPADAKALTEKLAQHTAGSKVLADAKTALNPPPAGAAAPPAATASQPAAPQGQSAQVGQTGGAADQGAQAAPPARPRRVAHAHARPKAPPADAAAQAPVRSAPTAPAGQAAVAAPARSGPVPAVSPTAKPG